MKDIKTEYRRIQDRNYLVLSFADRQEEERVMGHYGLRMASVNRISGLIPLEYQSQDDFPLLRYDVSGLRSLASVLERQRLDASALKGLLFGLAAAIEEMKEYLLSPGDLLMDLSCIYGEGEGLIPRFCYIPGIKGDFFADLSELLSSLLSYMEEKEQYGVVLAYQLYQKSLKAGYTMEELLKILSAKEEELFSEEAKRVKTESALKRSPSFDTGAREGSGEGRQKEQETEGVKSSLFSGFDKLESGFRIKNIFSKKKGDNQIKTADFFLEEKKSSFIDPEWKAFLQEAPEQSERGPSEKSNPLTKKEASEARCLLKSMQPEVMDIGLHYFPFVIGKKERVCDYVLEAEGVARMHMMIEETGDGFRLCNLHSQNALRINGRGMEPREKTDLKTGDEIEAAGLLYRFVISQGSPPAPAKE